MALATHRSCHPPSACLTRPAAANTRQMLGFLGFNPKDLIIAGGTREKADVDQQVDLVARARALGAGLKA